MGSPEEFESALKDVVQGKRLSASKMTKLTDIALKSMKNDTQLVSILYRTHKSLPASAKVSSLYAFDALARAARGQVNKFGLTGDINSEKGNSATFLLKVEGVLDGLFQDMISSGVAEAKEKTKKVLDIWIKSNTFPSIVLTRLADLLKGNEKEPELKPNITPDPRSHSTPTNPTPPQVGVTPVPQPSAQATVDSVQSTLLALLSQAANAAAQTAPNTSIPAPTLPTAQLGANGIALIQQLAQAQLTSGGPSRPPLTLPFVPAQSNVAPATSVGGPSHPPYRGERHDYDRRGGHSGPERARSRDDYYEDRRDYPRGGYRGGFRGGRGRGRWDDHDRSRDRDRSPPRGQRSRSRSPPRSRFGRRDIKPYSPPRKPSMKELSLNAVSVPSGEPQSEKDEFGRDVRPQSSKLAGPLASSNDNIDMQPQAAPATAPVSRSSVEPSPTPAIPSEHHPPTAPKAAEQGATPQTTSQEGLETFDFTTFDYTSPAAWELLGKAWAVSYGYLPSQEELMQLVVARSMTDVGAASTSQGTMQGDQWSANGWMGSYGGIGNEEMWNGDGQGDWTAGGMGVSYYGNGRDGQEQWGFGGSPSEVSEAPMVASNPAVSAPAELLDKSEAMLEEQSGGGGNSVGASGRMQKVGDKWIFVKGAA